MKKYIIYIFVIGLAVIAYKYFNKNKKSENAEESNSDGGGGGGGGGAFNIPAQPTVITPIKRTSKTSGKFKPGSASSQRVGKLTMIKK